MFLFSQLNIQEHAIKHFPTGILEVAATGRTFGFTFQFKNVLAHARRWLRYVLILSGRYESRGQPPTHTLHEVGSPRSPHAPCPPAPLSYY